MSQSGKDYNNLLRHAPTEKIFDVLISRLENDPLPEKDVEDSIQKSLSTWTHDTFEIGYLQNLKEYIYNMFRTVYDKDRLSIVCNFISNKTCCSFVSYDEEKKCIVNLFMTDIFHPNNHLNCFCTTTLENAMISKLIDQLHNRIWILSEYIRKAFDSKTKKVGELSPPEQMEYNCWESCWFIMQNLKILHRESLEYEHYKSKW